MTIIVIVVGESVDLDLSPVAFDVLHSFLIKEWELLVPDLP